MIARLKRYLAKVVLSSELLAEFNAIFCALFCVWYHKPRDTQGREAVTPSGPYVNSINTLDFVLRQYVSDQSLFAVSITTRTSLIPNRHSGANPSKSLSCFSE